MTNKREFWVDSAKAWGMLLIFHGHIIEYALGNNTSGIVYEQFRFIYSFHVPLFFLLAGYVSKKPKISFLSIIEKKISTLIIPAILFILLTIPFELVDDFLNNNFAASKYLTIGFGILKGVPQTSWMTWFLFSLFSAQLLYWLIYPIFEKNKFICLLLLYIIGSFNISYLPNSPIPNIWFLHNCFMVCFFLFLGHYAKLKKFNPTRINNKKQWSLMFLTGTLTYITLNLNTTLLAYEKAVPNLAIVQIGNPFAFMISTILGIIFISLVAQITSNIKWVREIGKMTLFLIYFAGLFFHFGNQIIIDNLPSLQNNLVLGTVLITIITFTISIIGSILLKKILPFPQFKFSLIKSNNKI